MVSEYPHPLLEFRLVINGGAIRYICDKFGEAV